MNVIEAGNLPESEKVFLKKDFFGWRVVRPIKNIDGSINWSNFIFGGLKNFLIVLVIIGLIIWVKHDANVRVESYGENCKIISQHPDIFCKKYISGEILSNKSLVINSEDG